MAVNLYDYANQLEQALRDSDEYKAIKDAFAKVKAVSYTHLTLPTKA